MQPGEPEATSTEQAEGALPTGPDGVNADAGVVVEREPFAWVTRPWQRPFVEALGTLGDVTSACKAVSISRDTAYTHRQANEGFALAWADALESAADALELELRKAATVGWPTRKTVTKTKSYTDAQGREVTETETTVTEGSERSVTAGIFLLNGARPKKYRQQHKVEHGGTGDAPPVRVRVERERSPRRLEELLEIASDPAVQAGLAAPAAE